MTTDPDKVAREIAEKLGDIHAYGYPELEPWIASAIRTAVAEAYEDAAKIADTEEELDGEPSQEAIDAMFLNGPVDNARAIVRATKKSIARRIRSKAKPPATTGEPANE